MQKGREIKNFLKYIRHESTEEKYCKKQTNWMNFVDEYNEKKNEGKKSSDQESESL